MSVGSICIGILGLIVGAMIGGYYIGHKYCLLLEQTRWQANKNMAIIRLYDAWMMAKENSMGIDGYLSRKNISSIAIYGMDYRGIRLFHELKDTSIAIRYGVDRNPPARIAGLDILHPDEIKSGSVDAVVVTAIFAFDGIKKDLESRGFTRILALDEMLYDLI